LPVVASPASECKSKFGGLFATATAKSTAKTTETYDFNNRGKQQQLDQ